MINVGVLSVCIKRLGSMLPETRTFLSGKTVEIKSNSSAGTSGFSCYERRNIASALTFAAEPVSKFSFRLRIRGIIVTAG